MSKATHHNIINRREALASVAALTAVPAGLGMAGAISIPAKSACVPDPIFQLIEEHRAARKAFDVLSGNEPAANNPAALYEFELNVHRLGDAARETTVALLTTAPTTLAGAVALLQYLQHYERDDYMTVDCGSGTGYDAVLSSLLSTITPMVHQ
jgi:hypothetical protein